MGFRMSFAKHLVIADYVESKFQISLYSLNL